MKDFKEIAEKCLKGELSGNFIIYHRAFAKDDVEILKVPSKNLIIDSLLLAFPYLFKGTGIKGITCPYIANFNGYGVNKLRNYQIINFIPDMKENDKRTIQVSLQQAREWYNSGNDTLKTLALSSFSKKELDPYPRSWEECKYKDEFSLGFSTKFYPDKFIINLMGKNSSYIKLLCLRQEWIHIWSQEQKLEKDWEPDWKNVHELKFAILTDQNNYKIVGRDIVIASLSFPTRELAEDFMNTFKSSFLEQAKGLY